jgi:hypothetical protein
VVVVVARGRWPGWELAEWGGGITRAREENWGQRAKKSLRGLPRFLTRLDQAKVKEAGVDAK